MDGEAKTRTRAVASVVPWPRPRPSVGTGEPARPRAKPSRFPAPCLCLFVGLALSAAAQANAQAPDLHWRTLRTEHFRVHFTDSLETIARRAAGNAERSYSRLAAELVPPRGPIDLVVADNVDFTNGQATFFPTNRITIFARPTVDATTLKFLDDWVDLLVSHELTHIFHLDRSRGLWRLGQYIFGRNPFLFPAEYSPSWLVEGIAVYEESRLTGAGRDIGTDFATIARSHALAGTTPRLNSLSLASPIYPLGNIAYAYGTQAVDRTAHGRPLRDFIEQSAEFPLPYFLNHNAEAGFGISFDSAYRVWVDSVRRDALSLAQRMPAPTLLTKDGWFTTSLRWQDATHLIYGGADAKSLPALKRVATTGGASEVVAIRNSNDATSPLPDGARVFAQFDLTDRYSERTDLYLERGGDVKRLTTGERIAQPDARQCGSMICVVAVQMGPATSRLVRIRIENDQATISPITGFASDTIYSDPRWSRRGDRIAATRWTRGGISEIAILDSGGRVISGVGRSRAVNSAPSWGLNDTTIFFTSDRSGRSALYRASLLTGRLFRIAESATGFIESEPSPDGLKLATFQYTNTGLDVAVIPSTTAGTAADSTSVLPPSRNDPIVSADGPVSTYSPWRTFLPRYWLPTLEGATDRPRYGFLTSGTDVINRHSFDLSASYEPKRAEPSFNFGYGYAGFGNPTVGVAGEELWDHLLLPDSAGRTAVGTFSRRRYFADGSITFARPRIAIASSLTIGGEYEWRDFPSVEPADALSHTSSAVRAALAKKYTYESWYLSAGVSNARQPALALGPEGGISLSGSVRQRWRTDSPDATKAFSVVGAIAGYKAFDLGGFAHHLFAVRVATGIQDITSATEFSAGGISGSTLEIAPGVTIGDGRRTFFARGFPVDAQTGSQAMAVNAEYRFPLFLPATGLWRFPLFFQRVSGVVFSDAATAWCPSASNTSPICFQKTAATWMASAGAELHLDTALQYDRPYRFRLGVAVPTAGRTYFGTSSVKAYVTLGVPF